MPGWSAGKTFARRMGMRMGRGPSKENRSDMMRDMGTFYVGCRIENPVARNRTARLAKVLVDTGSEYTWVPEAALERIGIAREKKDLEFIMANGKRITRSVGFAIIRLD